MLRLLALAVRVELLREVADAGLLVGCGSGKSECLEAAGFVVAWPIFECSTRRQRPSDVNPRRQHAMRKAVLHRYADHHVIAEHVAVDKPKKAMLCRLGGAEVAAQRLNRGTDQRSLPAEAPP